jgi:hypothetical protein
MHHHIYITIIKLRTTLTKLNHLRAIKHDFSIFKFNYHVRVRLLLTVSTTDISVLHSTEVAQLYPQAVYPLYHWSAKPVFNSEVNV